MPAIMLHADELRWLVQTLEQRIEPCPKQRTVLHTLRGFLRDATR